MVFKKQKRPAQSGHKENSIAFLQGRFFFRENINDWTYKLDGKVAAVFPGTVRYICGSLTSKGKKWPIFQVLLDEHEQILTSSSDFVASVSCIPDT